MRPRDLVRGAGLATGALLLATPAAPQGLGFAAPFSGPGAGRSAAGAVPGGTLTFFPSNSIDQAAIKARTSAGCPSQADSYTAVVKGHGFPADGLIVTAPTRAGMSRTEGFDVYFAQTMKDFASDNKTTLKGRYDVAVYCIDSFLGTKFAQFTGALTFTTPTRFKASGKNTMTSAPAAPATTSAAPRAEVPTTPAGDLPRGPEPSTTLVSGPVADSGGGLPIGWIAAGIAAVLLAFEIGRRVGRRSSTQP